MKGVTSTAVGYSGDHLKIPTYKDVYTGKTGYAEVVEVEYNPAIVSYEQLLNGFWNSRNPSSPNRQEPDIGTQYRSVIFHTLEQEAAAIASKD